jgi:tellurite methyltransferase
MAHLACGHGQHTRHNPPLNERAWVLTEAGRAAKVGSELACVRCDRSELPDGFAPYKRTPTFTEATVPRGLLETHSTKEGVWGLIHVVEGELEYVKHAPFDTRDVVTPSATAVVIACG